MGDALAVRQELGQVLGAEDVPEGGLSQQARGEVSIGHVGHGGDGVADAEVHHAVDADRDRVFGQDLEGGGGGADRECTPTVTQRMPLMEGRYLLWWDVEGNCSQIYFHEGIGARQDEEDACYKRGEGGGVADDSRVFCFARPVKVKGRHVYLALWPSCL